MEVIIDTADDILYKSFYVYGLTELFGEKKIEFSPKPFLDLSWRSRNTKSMRFVVSGEGRTRRYVIACNDSYQVDEELYDWCDVYGSVNANYAKTPERFHDKLVSLCPSFGIRVWNLPQTVLLSLRHISASETSVRKFLGKYKRQWERMTYRDYSTSCPTEAEENYVFFLSTLWYNDEWNCNDMGVNARRANFIRASKALDGVRFEGGLVSQGQGRSSEDLFSDCLCDGVPMKEWIEKTRRSALVFNTPAFWDCHGWKLGEYLAMGKCIVSTKLSNDLPAPLEHGNNIHFVENSQEAMKEAVQYIVDHPDYRAKLEKGARTYWEKYGTPTASLKLMGVTL